MNRIYHFPLFTMVDGVYYVQAGSPLWENIPSERGQPTTDSSSFNLLNYYENVEGQPLHIRPISFSVGTQLIVKNPLNFYLPIETICEYNCER